MQLPERVKSISPNDKVLEIGPGGLPHPRADVFLELAYEDKTIAEEQRGHAPELKTKKPIVYYDGSHFPFKDKEFDYIICSHVLEHVPDIEFFLSEIFRVGRKGYLEYPLIYYEYLYNFNAHLNILKFKDSLLYYLKKSDIPLSEFKNVQSLFHQTLTSGYKSFIAELRDYVFEGFEWSEPFSSIKASGISDLVWDEINIPSRKEDPFISKYLFLKGLLYNLFKRK